MKIKNALLLALCLLAAGCKTYNVQPGGVVNNYAPPPAPYPASYVVTDSGGAVIYAAPAQTGWYGSTYCWYPFGNPNNVTYHYKYTYQSAPNCSQPPHAAGPPPSHKQQANQGNHHKQRKAQDI